MEANVARSAHDLLAGALGSVPAGEGWFRPSRFTSAQVAALGSIAAWHPRLYREMAGCTAGIRLELETDSAHLALEASMDPFPSGSAAMLADALDADPSLRPPYDGFSLVADGRRLGVRVPGDDGLVRFALGAVPGKRRRVQLWLPCLTGCRLRAVVGDGSLIEPVAPSRPLLVLGDSISQGFTATDPALAWPALLASGWGLGLVNQGVGGQVFQPGSVADAARAVPDPALIVVELGANYRFEPCRSDPAERDARAYLAEVSRAWPRVPTVVLTTLFHTEDRYPTHPSSCFADIDRIIREAAAAHPQMRVVEGSGILPADPDLLIDGSDHPGPEGQVTLYQNLRKAVSLLGGNGAA